MVFGFFFFFFKQKTAYEMRISDWSSDVCSSDLNALNAIAAIAVAREMGLEEAGIRKALANFGGVKRRFTRTGEAGSIAVIDDYGHHPVEIAAVLAAARQAGSGRVIAVVQPHRYSRLHDLFEQFCTCFNEADTVIVADV